MFKWILKKKKSAVDKNEEMIKALFSFLLDDYGFHFARGDLGNAVDKNGNFIFYGPLEAYYVYNSNVCINILYLVQRQDYNIYITDAYKADQIYIINGVAVSDHLAYDLHSFSAEVKNSVLKHGEIYGRKI